MNGRIFLNTIFLLSLTTITQAQLRFQKTIGGPVLDWANSIAQTPDSGYIILGSTKNFGAGQEDLYLIKINELGDTMWTRTFGGNLNDEEGGFVKLTNDGGYILSGTALSFGAGSGDLYLVKTDSNGNMEWSKTYGGVNMDFCTGVNECTDDGYIITGYTSSFGAGGADAYLVRTDAVGAVQWTKTLGIGGADRGYSALQTLDGGYIVTGSIGNEILLSKLDNMGNLTWTKSYGGALHDIGYCVIQTIDSGYCIAGSTSSFGAGDTNIILLNTDANGNILWTTTYGGAFTEECLSVFQNADGGYILTGYTNSLGSGYDLLIIRTDVWGQQIWSGTIGGFSNARDEGRSTIETFDGGYIVVGYTQSFGAGGGTDIFVVKTDSTGLSGCNHVTLLLNTQVVAPIVNTLTITPQSGGIENLALTDQNAGGGVGHYACSTIGINETEVGNTQVMLQPNPFSSYTIITINTEKNVDRIFFTLCDMQGRTVKNFAVNVAGNAITFTLNRESLAPGMYFYNIVAFSAVDSSKGGEIEKGKLIIE